MEKEINVFILIFCRNLELFYGSELIFKTLRVGFPNAKVTVLDNGSLPSAIDEIKILARENDCLFEEMHPPGIQHYEFLQNTIRMMADRKGNKGPLVFLDPDICLWDSCEDFSFEGLIAGRAIGRFYDQCTKTITMPRLHSSFLWIENPDELQREIRKQIVKRFDFQPFLSFSFRFDETWYRYDTGANLFAAIPDRVSWFTEDHLNRYDHIFSGSHIDWILDALDENNRKLMIETHELAKNGCLEEIKGIWKYQQEVWEENNGVPMS